jgi:hypothetical protein
MVRQIGPCPNSASFVPSPRLCTPPYDAVKGRSYRYHARTPPPAPGTTFHGDPCLPALAPLVRRPTTFGRSGYWDLPLCPPTAVLSPFPFFHLFKGAAATWGFGLGLSSLDKRAFVARQCGHVCGWRAPTPCAATLLPALLLTRLPRLRFLRVGLAAARAARRHHVTCFRCLGPGVLRCLLPS